MTFFLHEMRYRDLAPASERMICICGAGALGANLAETLARMGMRQLRVIDRDRIAAHNLSTQPWTQQDIGAQKARVLANALYQAVGARVDARAQELTQANGARLLAGSAVIVDAFDNPPARAAVGAAGAELGVDVLHIALGSDGDYGCALWNDGYVLPGAAPGDQAQLDTCDYPLTRPLALLLANLAAELLVGYLLGGVRRTAEWTLRDLRISVGQAAPLR